jgi:tellurite resistance protein TehA-like permease
LPTTGVFQHTMNATPEERQEPAPAAAPRGGLSAGLAGLSPAYFGMVMATGIVSLAAHRLAMPGVAQALFHLNVGIYCVLWVLTLWRMARHPRRFFGDMVDHLRGPGFFTMVAGTSLLASQFMVLAANFAAAAVLWVVALALWVGLTYGIFAGIIIKERKPDLDQGISGGWLLAVVATNSIAVLSALLAAHIDQPARLAMNFLALAMWLWGGMFYIWMMSLIFYRYTFFPLSPGDLSPSYWINMGAMAISTLAGSLLAINSPDAPFLFSLLPFIKGFTIFCWATATWWIPMLLVLTLWRHAHRRFPLEYDPLYWGAVFPLGMYAAGTDLMVEAMGLHFLARVPTVFLYVALAAWLAACAGLAGDLLRRSGALRG